MIALAEKPLKASHKHFAEIYTTNGHNGADAYRKAYPNCISGHKQAAERLLTNVDLKAYIANIDAKTAAKMDLSRESQYLRLLNAHDKANTANSPAAMVGALREMNEMLGYHRDKAPNEEQAQAVVRRMTTQDRLIAEEVARLLTERKQVESTVIE